MIASSLANGRVGADAHYQWAVRFQAKYTGTVSGFRSEWILENPPGKAGYAAGWRGTFAWSIWSDADGTPGSFLASGVRTPDARFAEYSANGAFPFIEFPNAPVIEGNWYWIIVENVDADAVNNYASIDFLVGDPAQCADMQVWWRWAERGQYVAWQQKSGWLPSPFCVYYADGGTQGYNGIEVDSTGAVVPGTEYGFPA